MLTLGLKIWTVIQRFGHKRKLPSSSSTVKERFPIWSPNSCSVEDYQPPGMGDAPPNSDGTRVVDHSY